MHDFNFYRKTATQHGKIDFTHINLLDGFSFAFSSYKKKMQVNRLMDVLQKNIAKEHTGKCLQVNAFNKFKRDKFTYMTFIKYSRF